MLYDYLLRRFLLPAFGPVPLGRLDMMTVRAWLADLHRAGEVTPTTIAKAYRLAAPHPQCGSRGRLPAA